MECSGIITVYLRMSKKQAKNGVKTLSLRLPQTVAKAVAKRAKEQNRSLNAQICHELSPGMAVWSQWQGSTGAVTVSDNNSVTLTNG